MKSPLGSSQVEDVIFLAEDGGLANRLRALVGYQALAELTDTNFYLCWVPNKWCDACFEDLFIPEGIYLIKPAELSDYLKDLSTNIYSQCLWFNQIWETYLEPQVHWEQFSEVALEYLTRLQPHQTVLDRLDRFLKEYDLSSAIGVHIRWTDNLKGNEQRKMDATFDPAHISKIEGFQRFIDDQIHTSPAKKIFLATDNPDVEKDFRKKYGQNLIVFPKKYLRNRSFFSLLKNNKAPDSLRASSIEDALIEMLLLAKCQTILGTYYSSFSKLSALWGSKAYYEVRGVDYEQSGFVEYLSGKPFTK